MLRLHDADMQLLHKGQALEGECGVLETAETGMEACKPCHVQDTSCAVHNTLSMQDSTPVDELSFHHGLVSRRKHADLIDAARDVELRFSRCMYLHSVRSTHLKNACSMPEQSLFGISNSRLTNANFPVPSNSFN